MDRNVNTGALVTSATGEQIGFVEQVIDSGSGDAQVLMVRQGEHTYEVPLDLVDTSRSTTDDIVLTASFAAEQDYPRTIEVRAEQARIDVHDIELGRVVIDKTIEYVPVRQDVEIGTDNVEVRRVPSGEEFDVRPESRQDGDILIVPVVEEVLVLTRRYRVIEEVHVIKHRDTHIEQLDDELMREVVTVREELHDGSVREL